MSQTHHYTGLTEAEVADSRGNYGVNILTPPEKEPLWRQFLKKFGDPLIIILMIAGVLSVGISCYEYWTPRCTTRTNSHQPVRQPLITMITPKYSILSIAD